MGKLLRRIYNWIHRDRLAQEFEDEMAAHREMMPPHRRDAFGNSLRLHDEARDAWGLVWLDHCRQDLLYAFRGLTRDRRFTLSAVAAIALAIGAATAVFSVVDRSLFRPLPYSDDGRLVSVGLTMPSFGNGEFMFLGAYRDWQTSQSAMDLTSWSGVTPCDVGSHAPQRLNCARVDATFLPTLGVHPLLGRNFTPEEDRPDANPVALITHGMWQSAFGRDPGVLDRLMVVDGAPVHIAGVLPADFELPDLTSVEVLLAQRLPPGPGKRNVPLAVIARLRPGYTMQSAATAMTQPFEQFRADFGARAGAAFAHSMSLRIESLRERQVRQHRLALWMLLGAVAALVMIACANVTNLLLARSSGRQREFAIRTALGCSRRRLMAQLLTESVLLGAVGGAAGCGLAWGLLRVFISLAPDGALRLRQASVDPRVLAFALALSLGAALAFGLAPSVSYPRMRPSRSLLRPALISAQLAVSLLLLTGAGLLLTSLWRLENAPLGFERQRVITATFTLPAYRYASDARQLNFFRELETQLTEIPGATSGAIADSVPPGAGVRTVPYFALAHPGAAVAGEDESGSVKWRYVTPGYFEALGIPIRRGRGFNDGDRQTGVRNIVVNESLARRFFGDRDPIGGRLGDNNVIGVAADVRNAGIDRAADPEFYQVRKASREGIAGSSDPDWWRRATVVVRSALSEQDAATQLRATMQQLDGTIPLKLETMQMQVDRFLTRPRFQTALLAMFAVAGLMLAAIGLYGLVAFLVSERTREIGVRMALGATPGSVTRLVVGQGLRWIIAGVIVGMTASGLLLRLLLGLLYGVTALDVRVFAGAVIALVAVAVLAAWLPAQRAARVDPMHALRQD